MAVKEDFTPLEKAWLKKCVAFQRQALVRARGKEMAGSEIWSLRGREIDELVALEQKL